MPMPSKQEQNLQFFKDRQNLNLPYSFQIQGSQPGPHLAFVGATHGNEIVGVEAIVELVKFLEKENLQLDKGKISFIIGNPKAYRQRVRFIDENLNRVFTGQYADTVESRRAEEISKFLKEAEGLTALVDLHSVSVGTFSAVVYPPNPASISLSQKISNLNLHFSTEEEHTPGLLISFAANLNKAACVIECGNHTDIHSINVALEHIVRTITHFDLLPITKLPFIELKSTSNQEILVYKTIAPIKPHRNFHFTIPEVETGTPIRAGQLYAVDEQTQHVAPQDCFIVMPDKNPKFGDHDAGFLAIKEIIYLN